jgi:hypothetical protein
MLRLCKLDADIKSDLCLAAVSDGPVEQMLKAADLDGRGFSDGLVHQ